MHNRSMTLKPPAIRSLANKNVKDALAIFLDTNLGKAHPGELWDTPKKSSAYSAGPPTHRHRLGSLSVFVRPAIGAPGARHVIRRCR